LILTPFRSTGIQARAASESLGAALVILAGHFARLEQKLARLLPVFCAFLQRSDLVSNQL
jgi:hypothetical protein